MVAVVGFGLLAYAQMCQYTGNVEYRKHPNNSTVCQFKNNNAYAVDVYYEIDGQKECHVWLPASSQYTNGDCTGSGRIMSVQVIACKTN